MVVLPTGGGEATNPENMGVLYASVLSWGMEEEENILLPDWKRVDEYRDPVDPNSLYAKFAAMFPELASLLNYCVECTLILNYITQDNNKVLRDKRNKTVNFHRLERSMEEYVSTFQSVVDMEQQNGGPQKK